MVNIVKKLEVNLLLISTFNVFLVLILQVYTISIVGTGYKTDALVASLTIPTILLLVLSGSLNNVLVPLMSGRSKEEINDLAWSYIFILGGIATLICAILFISTELWFTTVFSGFDEKTLELGVLLSKFQLIFVLFSIYHSIIWSSLNAKSEHIRSEIIPFILNVLFLPVYYFFLPQYDVLGLVIINLIKMFIQNVVQSITIEKPNVRHIFSTEVLKSGKRILPLLLGSVYFKSGSGVDRHLLSQSHSGTMTLFYLCQKVFDLTLQILNKAFIIPQITKLSALNNNLNFEKSHKEYKVTLKRISFIALTVLFVSYMSIFLVNSLLPDIASIYIDDFDTFNIIICGFSLYFFGNFLGGLISSAFYSLGNTVIPTKMSMLTYTIFLIIKFVSFNYYGVLGLSIAIGMNAIVNLACLAMLFKYKRKELIRGLN